MALVGHFQGFPGAQVKHAYTSIVILQGAPTSLSHQLLLLLLSRFSHVPLCATP